MGNKVLPIPFSASLSKVSTHGTGFSSVDRSVRKVYCGKTAERIRMPLGVSGVGRGMGVLHRGGYRRREGTVLGVNLGRPVVTNEPLLHSCVEVREPIEPSFGW